MDRVARKPADGVLRVGRPTDFAVGFLRRVMTDLAQAHARVRLGIVCELSRGLFDDLRRDELNIVIAMTSEGGGNMRRAKWVEYPCWEAAKFLDGESGETGKMRVQFEGTENHVNVCGDGR
jgi:DNA-binding transcriptional LysR family regulator